MTVSNTAMTLPWSVRGLVVPVYMPWEALWHPSHLFGLPSPEVSLLLSCKSGWGMWGCGGRTQAYSSHPNQFPASLKTPTYYFHSCFHVNSHQVLHQKTHTTAESLSVQKCLINTKAVVLVDTFRHSALQWITQGLQWLAKSLTYL